MKQLILIESIQVLPKREIPGPNLVQSQDSIPPPVKKGLDPGGGKRVQWNLHTHASFQPI
jgi:hypothetical protein